MAGEGVAPPFLTPLRGQVHVKSFHSPSTLSHTLRSRDGNGSAAVSHIQTAHESSALLVKNFSLHTPSQMPLTRSCGCMAFMIDAVASAANLVESGLVAV
jgi:hypothetical protein